MSESQEIQMLHFINEAKDKEALEVLEQRVKNIDGKVSEKFKQAIETKLKEWNTTSPQ